MYVVDIVLVKGVSKQLHISLEIASINKREKHQAFKATKVTWFLDLIYKWTKTLWTKTCYLSRVEKEESLIKSNIAEEEVVGN